MKRIIFSMLVMLLLSSCEERFPISVIRQGEVKFVIYKAQKVRDDYTKYGEFKYAITDDSNHGWTYYSFERYSIGDTLEIININK